MAKCSIAECEKTFSVVYESHHAIENQPVIICNDHFQSLLISADVLADTQKRIVARRCCE